MKLTIDQGVSYEQVSGLILSAGAVQRVICHVLSGLDDQCGTFDCLFRRCKTKANDIYLMGTVSAGYKK